MEKQALKHYQKINIKITLKYGIEKKSLPIDFKEAIRWNVNKLFPNWNFIEYEFTN